MLFGGRDHKVHYPVPHVRCPSPPCRPMVVGVDGSGKMRVRLGSVGLGEGGGGCCADAAKIHTRLC